MVETVEEVETKRVEEVETDGTHLLDIFILCWGLFQ